MSFRKKSKGNIFIISAPSGAGKTTLCKRITETDRNLKQSVSFTSRGPRDGEVHEVDYSFISEKEFREMIEREDFVEWAKVHGNLYGTSRKRLEDLMAAGFDILLDIDTQGANQIRNSFDGGVFIFILPPSMKVLRERLEQRKSNTPEDMARRLARARDEIQDYGLYDYVIVNDMLDDSLAQLQAILSAERMRSSKVDSRWIQEYFLSQEDT